jgi:hypothetical protein
MLEAKAKDMAVMALRRALRWVLFVPDVDCPAEVQYA